MADTKKTGKPPPVMTVKGATFGLIRIETNKTGKRGRPPRFQVVERVPQHGPFYPYAGRFYYYLKPGTTPPGQWKDLQPDEHPAPVKRVIQDNPPADNTPLVIERITDHYFVYYICIDGVWRKSVEPFYKTGGQLARAVYTPKDWQPDFFTALETGEPKALERWNKGQKETVVANYHALDLSVDELRAISALNKLYELRNWEGTRGAGATTYDAGEWDYNGTIPNIVFSLVEYKELYGVGRYVDKDGKRRFYGRESEKAEDALKKLSTRSYTLPAQIHRGELTRIVTISGSLIRLQIVTDWMNKDELSEHAAGRGPSRLKYAKVIPSPIFFMGIQTNNRLLTGKKADYVLTPWSLEKDLRRVNPAATDANVHFMGYLFKVLSDQKKHTPPSSDRKNVWTITRTDRELIRALNWQGIVRARAWKKARENIRRRCEDGKRAGFILSYSFHAVRHYPGRSRNVHKIIIRMNPRRCEYQG